MNKDLRKKFGGSRFGVKPPLPQNGDVAPVTHLIHDTSQLALRPYTENPNAFKHLADVSRDTPRNVPCVTPLSHNPYHLTPRNHWGIRGVSIA